MINFTPTIGITTGVDGTIGGATGTVKVNPEGCNQIGVFHQDHGIPIGVFQGTTVFGGVTDPIVLAVTRPIFHVIFVTFRMVGVFNLDGLARRLEVIVRDVQLDITVGFRIHGFNQFAGHFKNNYSSNVSRETLNWPV